jgi:hypothetical protein
MAATVVDLPLQAQTPASMPNAVLQSCIMGTDPSVWASLKLTTDQLERVKRVQEACLEECEAAGAAKAAGSTISTADGSTVVAELKNVLSTDQFAQWITWCSQRPADPAKKR